MDEMLTEALRLRNLGFAVHWLRPGEKIPVASGWSDAPVPAVTDLKRSYVSGYNLGFRPGKFTVVNGKEICVLDVDIRGGDAYAEEAYAAAKSMLSGHPFDVMSGSIVGRHKYLAVPIGKSPSKAATTLRQSDIWIDAETGEPRVPGSPNARPAWLIEILSTGKNVVLPPSIHPDTKKPYKFL